jgi:predicted TIM-barrel fold metal-dependent hydrolase
MSHSSFVHPHELPLLSDAEGERVPSALPPIIDAHVHLFPDRIFAAIRHWFEQHAWPIRYSLKTPAVIEFLLSRGVERIVALHYAHKPGLARPLNAYMAQACRGNERVLGLATVFPGETGAKAILEEAFALGLGGVKLHCHVQGMRADDESMHEIYETCASSDRPLVLHAGRAPRVTGYPFDPHELCSAARVEHALRDHPRLRLCVPHLGADELDAYERLLERYDNLWLDTTMMLADYFEMKWPRRLLEARPDRIMYGTDFPNVPYAWDRELRRLAHEGLAEPVLAQILGGTARAFFRLG